VFGQNEAILERRSIRSYTTIPISREILENIVLNCRWAGSFMNIQPWEFAILGGEVMAEWKKRLIHQFEADDGGERDVFPEMLVPEPYLTRAERFRSKIDSLMFPPGEEDMEQKRHDYTVSGIQVRDAPNAIVVYTDKKFIRSTLHMIAIGMVVQNVCLSATSYGLGTCVMGRPVEQPGILRQMLNIPESKSIPCVIAIGFADQNARINSLVRERLPLQDLVHWYGF
jgi:nitroreductase